MFFNKLLERFLRKTHSAYVRAIYEQLQNTDEPKSLESLFREFPSPEVEVTPMANKTSIREFLDSFAKLTHLEFRILATNREIPREATFRALQEMRGELGSKSTKLVHDSKEGLNIARATDEISASAAAGNQKVILAGKAADGTELRGNNDSFKLRVIAEDLPDVPKPRAIRLVKEYFKQVLQGRLRPDLSETDTGKVEAIRESLGGDIEQG